MPDFDQVVNSPEAAFTDQMAEQLRISEAGPQIAYHLAKNRDEAMRVAGLSERDMIREFGRIEERLSKPPPRRVSQAPEPLKEGVKGSGSQTGFDPATATPKEMQEHLKAKNILS